MARAILVIGEPGTGKSRAIKGLNPAETVIIKPNSKELPFRGAAKMYVQGKNMFTLKTLSGLGSLLDQLNKAKWVKNVVIEDITHYFSKKVVDDRGIKGYDKWTELAALTKMNIVDKESELRPDLNMIVIGHVASGADAAGNTVLNIQTPGKLMDNVIKIPSYFTYVMHTVVGPDDQGNMKYQFLTNKDGMREAKSPEDMFPKYIDNDYQQVIDGIIKYQNEEGLTPVGTTLEQKAKLDEKKAATAPKAEDVAAPEAKTDAPEFKEAPTAEAAPAEEAAK